LIRSSLQYFRETFAPSLAELEIDERGFSRQAKPLRHFQLAYLSADETDEKVVFSFDPRPCTTAMIATEMPAAINPYSIAVAAVSSLRKEYVRFFIANSLWRHAGPMIF
jgi:hypothetical protein